MTWWRTVLGVVAAGCLWHAAPAQALCTCGDLPSGCGSALNCVGSSPGDACSPPKNATCKIREGLGTQAVCCCGCTRGPGPVSCNYTPVTNAMPTLRSAATVCESAQVIRLANRAVPKAERALMTADAACERGKNAAPHAARAQRGLEKLKTKLQTLEERGKIAAGCSATYGTLLDQYVAAIDGIETAGDPGAFGSVTTTTAATTTTTLGGSSKVCSGAFTLFPSDANEVDFTFSCSGATTGKTGFVIGSAGRNVTNFLEPAGFTCQIQTDGGDDALACMPSGGTFDSGTTREGRLRFTPAPTGGMGGFLRLQQGATSFGPFALTGP